MRTQHLTIDLELDFVWKDQDCKILAEPSLTLESWVIARNHFGGSFQDTETEVTYHVGAITILDPDGNEITDGEALDQALVQIQNHLDRHALDYFQE